MNSAIDQKANQSPSPRRAWIEIIKVTAETVKDVVALPTEGVDRNRLVWGPVACWIGVALPTEGVDRNALMLQRAWGAKMSPSPRRAWIEIELTCPDSKIYSVALPTEGVDRNRHQAFAFGDDVRRPPHGGRG